MSECVRIESSDHVAVVTLNRPAKHNAVDIETFDALIAAGDALAADRSVRSVVLTGAGDNFCAGIDVSVFAAGDPAELTGSRMQAREGTPANFYQSAAYVWKALPVPVIAAIRGVAFGAGFQIAMGADIRIATSDARFSIMEGKWGLIPDMAISATLRDVLPLDVVKLLAYTGRIIDGTSAAGLGVVTETSEDPLRAAQHLAREIASKSPDAIRRMKTLFNNGWAATVPDALRLEASLQSDLLGGPNQAEAVMANFEKREPQFVDPQQ